MENAVTKQDLQEALTVFGQHILHEVGKRFEEIGVRLDKLTQRFDLMDARQRGDAAVTTNLMDLVVRQTRWHQQSDNNVADLMRQHGELLARQMELERRLDDLGPNI